MLSKCTVVVVVLFIFFDFFLCSVSDVTLTIIDLLRGNEACYQSVQLLLLFCLFSLIFLYFFYVVVKSPQMA